MGNFRELESLIGRVAAAESVLRDPVARHFSLLQDYEERARIVARNTLLALQPPEVAGAEWQRRVEALVAGVRAGLTEDGILLTMTTNVAREPQQREVGFADTEADHVLHGRDDFEKIADAGAGEVYDRSRQTLTVRL
jgi:hypothetical protein